MKSNKKFNFKKIWIILLVLLVIIPISILINKINTKNINVEDSSTSEENSISGITNILLLGTDGRENELDYRSDCMMIVTIDTNNKNIKLTSLARDTYVNIQGKGNNKLNAAYFFGKEDLLFQTIEENFGVKLDKFIQVDFDNLMNIVFILDGVEVDVKEHEVNITNELIPSSYDQCTYEDKGEMKLIDSPGKQVLNGYQAIAYSRIRYTDSAIHRDSRQRQVMLSAINKVKNMPFSSYHSLLNSLSPYMSTNLTETDIINIGSTVYSFKPLTVKQGKFPIIDDIHVKGGIYKNAGWVWLYDLNSTVVLQDFIYKDVDMDKNEYLNDNGNIKLNY